MNNSENEFKNAWWKQLTAWIIVDNQTKNKAKKLLSELAGPLMKVAIPLAKNVSAPLGITVAPSAIGAGIQKKIHCSGTIFFIIWD